jgi:HSP20 family protein
MSNLVNVPKNGSLKNSTTNVNFPTWSAWFNDIFGGDIPSIIPSSIHHGVTLPKVNIRETADAYLVEMAVPGMKKSDFQIELENNLLSISSESKEESENQNSTFTSREFSYSSFKRSFTLPESVNDEKIEANYKDGILYVLLPKKDEAKKKPARSIKIS